MNPGIVKRKQLKGKAYWRSLEELADSAEFQDAMYREFPEVATEALSPASRREFLRVMGASLALAGLSLTACRLPKEKIAPYAYRQPGVTPGIPRQFATSMELGGVAQPMLVTSYDGRPIKVEGNPSHPASQGAASAMAQASVLDVYDQDRSKCPGKNDGDNTTPVTWDEFLAEAGPLFDQLKADGGAGLRVLAHRSDSPSLMRARRKFSDAYPQAEWVEYNPLNNDFELAGTSIAYGAPLRLKLNPARAEVICCLDADILCGHPDAVRHAREFAAGRKADGGRMNRLYVAESTYSVTGTTADHRRPVRSDEIPALTCAIGIELAALLNSPLLAGNVGTALRHGAGRLAGDPFAKEVARDLASMPGRGIVAAGPQQPPAVHALTNLLNTALGNLGRTVEALDAGEAFAASQVSSIKELTAQIDRGAVKALVILGGNPAYDAPRDLEFANALSKVPDSFHLNTSFNETSAQCKWHLNQPHFMESWGDARAADGTYSPVQPLIAPLYGGKTAIELTAWIASRTEQSGYDFTRDTFRELFSPADLELEWRRALNDGMRQNSGFRPVDPAVDMEAVASALTEIKPAQGDWEVVLLGDYKMYDGRFANNGWLQEFPEPLSKLSWDNAALIGLSDADKLGAKHGDMLTISANGRTLDLPAYILPGQAGGSICLRLGYGRTMAGHIGDGVGVDTYELRTSDNPWVMPAEVRKGSGNYKLTTTQDHYVIDVIGFKERERRVGSLVRQGTLGEYMSNPSFAKEMDEHPPLISLWKEKEYSEGHRWAMAIDLSSCTGCGACVVACQAENNIPVVGKRHVSEGREMHWIRIDRYFSGEPQDARVMNQPVTCHHCEMAPCEEVCPVAATLHSDEGLNEMVYNRCIGTRYCSNNCPYKVRRFNFFNYRRHMSELEKMVQNPEVTVRSRGVMEKCSFCVQRIQNVKIQAKNHQRDITDGEITPACAQTCPSQAIIFGDLNDPKSRVRKAFEQDRAYAMLAELNVKPRINYLAKLTNPPGDQSRATTHSTMEHHE